MKVSAALDRFLAIGQSRISRARPKIKAEAISSFILMALQEISWLGFTLAILEQKYNLPQNYQNDQSFFQGIAQQSMRQSAHPHDL